MLWYGFCKINNIGSDMTSLNIFVKYSLKEIIFYRFPLIMMHLIHKTIQIKMIIFYLIFLTSVILFLLKKMKLDLFQKINLIFIFIFHLVIIGIYLNTPHPLYWHLSTSIRRVIFTPCLIILLFCSIILNKVVVKNYKISINV